MPSKKELKELVRSLTADNTAKDATITAKDATKDAIITAKDATIEILTSKLVIKEAEVNAIAAALDRRDAGDSERDVEIKRLVDDLDVSRCANRILGEIYSDLKKYEQRIIPTSCAQNCLRL